MYVCIASKNSLVGIELSGIELNFVREQSK